MGSIFSEVRMDFYDDIAELTSIDAWKTADDNEEGVVLGWFDHDTNKIIWAKDTTLEEKTDPLVVEAIVNFMNENNIG